MTDSPCLVKRMLSTAAQHLTCQSMPGCKSPLPCLAGASCEGWEAKAWPSYVRAISETAGVQQSACVAVCQEQLGTGKRRLLQAQPRLLISGKQTNDNPVQWACGWGWDP